MQDVRMQNLVFPCRVSVLFWYVFAHYTDIAPFQNRQLILCHCKLEIDKFFLILQTFTVRDCFEPGERHRTLFLNVSTGRTLEYLTDELNAFLPQDDHQLLKLGMEACDLE